jgi:hypothetical protein
VRSDEGLGGRRVVLLSQGKVVRTGPRRSCSSTHSPFVLDFLGTVNVFHGRVQAGQLGPLSVDYPGHPHEVPLPASGYARPHELEVFREAQGEDGFWARVTSVVPNGAIAKMELEPERTAAADVAASAPGPLKVEISRERYRDLSLAPGERLWVRPSRLTVFVEPRPGWRAAIRAAGVPGPAGTPRSGEVICDRSSPRFSSQPSRCRPGPPRPDRGGTRTRSSASSLTPARAPSPAKADAPGG